MAYAYAPHSWNANRFFGFFVALAINVLLLYGLAAGLVFHPPVDTTPPVVVIPVLEPDKPVPPPAAPDPYVPGRIAVDPPGLPPMNSITLERDPIVAGPTIVKSGGSGTMGSAPIITELQVDPAFFVKPNYPPRSVALEEEGIVQLLVYVLPDGRVGDVRVRKSSGYPRLDTAAVKTVRTKWRFRPRTQDGVPVEGWGTYSVRFALVN